MNRRICFSVLFVVFVSACSHYETGLDVGPVTGEFLPRFQVAGDVAVIGEYRTKPDMDQFFSVGPRKWFVSTNEMVDLAIEVAQDILRQNGAKLNEDAKKVLKISFVDGSCDGRLTLKLAFRIRVQAGDEVPIVFEGTQNTPGSTLFRWGIESAISYAAIKIFQDPAILEYLKN